MRGLRFGGSCGFGGGSDLTVSGTLTINLTAASASVTAGSSTVTLSNVRGTFAAGQRVLLHQTQAATGAVGHYEYALVASVSGTTMTLTAPAVSTYVTDSTRRAQVVVVQQVGALTVPSGAVLTAPVWDGNVGGILALDAAGTVTVGGRIDMTGAGFRGRAHGGPYRCGRGFQGEGQLALGGVTIAANGSGGGGGGAGQDGASGGGGAYGAAAASGGVGTLCGTCSEACNIPGGAGGGAVGTTSLATSMFLGGAGGEGGADEDGCHPGAGGNGGGIIIMRGNAFTVTGSVVANGAGGANGDNGSCGGGCGMGGGGGGSGGAVRIVSIGTATIGAGLVSANGAGGGAATCNGSGGGGGSVGRIGVNAPTVTGTSTPTLDRN